METTNVASARPAVARRRPRNQVRYLLFKMVCPRHITFVERFEPPRSDYL